MEEGWIMKTRFTFDVPGTETEGYAAECSGTVLKTVGAVIGYDFIHKPSAMTGTPDRGEVLVDDNNFWFMKSILERLEKNGLISNIASELA